MIFKSCIFLLALFILPGCATLNIVSLGVSGISYITTGKSLSDHALSAMREQDCAVHRFLFDESMCRKNSDMIETNSNTILAKNTEQKDTQLPINSINVMETGVAERAKPSTNIMELTASLEKSNVSSNFGSGKQFIKNKRSLYEEQWNNVAQYKVIGSFNNKSYAITRANLYQEMGAMVIANGKNHTEKRTKAYATKYRVVLDPYLANTQLLEAGIIAKTEKSTYWMLSLCTKTLSPPPCLNKKVILASNNIN
ncbi:MAG: hypothetical protein RPS47_00540 [Colwellia sp.]|jgi:hypothetical protein